MVRTDGTGRLAIIHQREPGAANNPPGKIQMFITKSRHEREMREAREADKAALDEYATNLDDARNNMALYRDDRDDWRNKHNSLLTKFKKAITDLEGEIRDRKKAQYDLALARLEVEALRPGHEANERRLKRDREQKAAKRSAKATVKGVGRG